jgi:uncharacterized protein (DUF2267 family)
MDTLASVAAKAMRERAIGCILVTDNQGRLSGIVTDRDFACRWAADYATQDPPISRIMTPDVLKADEDSSLTNVIDLMEKHGVRRIPIVSRDSRGTEKAIGIVTLDDLIASGMIAPSHLSRIVKQQIGRSLDVWARFSMKVPEIKGRSEAHMCQTLDRFYSTMKQVTGLNSDQVPPIVHFLLGSLVLRVTPTAAIHFIAQLPKVIQASLLSLPSGPDRHIDAPWMIAEISLRFQIPEESAQEVLSHFLDGLETLLGHESIQHFKSQLPRDLQALFPPAKDGRAEVAS